MGKDFFLLLGFLWLLNMAFTYWHVAHYQRTIASMTNRQSGFFGMGTTTSKWKAKQILLLGTDDDGVVEECKIISGFTIFARFRAKREITGYHISRIPAASFSKKFQQPLEQAICAITKEMNNTL